MRVSHGEKIGKERGITNAGLQARLPLIRTGWSLLRTCRTKCILFLPYNILIRCPNFLDMPTMILKTRSFIAPFVLSHVYLSHLLLGTDCPGQLNPPTLSCQIRGKSQCKQPDINLNSFFVAALLSFTS